MHSYKSKLEVITFVTQKQVGKQALKQPLLVEPVG